MSLARHLSCWYQSMMSLFNSLTSVVLCLTLLAELSCAGTSAPISAEQTSPSETLAKFINALPGDDQTREALLGLAIANSCDDVVTDPTRCTGLVDHAYERLSQTNLAPTELAPSARVLVDDMPHLLVTGAGSQGTDALDQYVEHFEAFARANGLTLSSTALVEQSLLAHTQLLQAAQTTLVAGPDTTFSQLFADQQGIAPNALTQAQMAALRTAFQSTTSHEGLQTFATALNAGCQHDLSNATTALGDNAMFVSVPLVCLPTSDGKVAGGITLWSKKERNAEPRLVAAMGSIVTPTRNARDTEVVMWSAQTQALFTGNITTLDAEQTVAEGQLQMSGFRRLRRVIRHGFLGSEYTSWCSVVLRGAIFALMLAALGKVIVDEILRGWSLPTAVPASRSDVFVASSLDIAAALVAGVSAVGLFVATMEGFARGAGICSLLAGAMALGSAYLAFNSFSRSLTPLFDVVTSKIGSGP